MLFPFIVDYSWHDLWFLVSVFRVGDGLVVVAKWLWHADKLSGSVSQPVGSHVSFLTIFCCLLSSRDKDGNKVLPDSCVRGWEGRWIVGREGRSCNHRDGRMLSIMAPDGLLGQGGMNPSRIEGSSVSELDAMVATPLLLSLLEESISPVINALPLLTSFIIQLYPPTRPLWPLLILIIA